MVSLFKQLLSPKNIQVFISTKFKDFFSSNFTFVIEQNWELCQNQTFRAAQIYLRSKFLARIITGEIHVGSAELKNPMDDPEFGIPVDTKIDDEFEGIHLEWSLHNIVINKEPFEKRYFILTCKKQFREKIMKEYFEYVATSAQKILNHQKNLYIYTYCHKLEWERALFKHHTTFETLVIEPHLKNMIINDLEAFLKGKEFFQSVGRAWKRGYLLYGPSGAGKSSMVAAIANYLNYDIYDLQIHTVKDDAELRMILTTIKNKSILLIEDIDCCSSTNLGISLSGLLNFIDGLWSSLGDEGIIIFTTNHKEKLDPALLCPGRMDVHVLMDYCTPYMMKKLVLLYLKINDHVLFDAIEKLISEVSVTPAEVTEQLMASKNVDIALKGLLKFMENKREN